MWYEDQDLLGTIKVEAYDKMFHRRGQPPKLLAATFVSDPPRAPKILAPTLVPNQPTMVLGYSDKTKGGDDVDEDVDDNGDNDENEFPFSDGIMLYFSI